MEPRISWTNLESLLNGVQSKLIFSSFYHSFAVNKKADLSPEFKTSFEQALRELLQGQLKDLAHYNEVFLDEHRSSMPHRVAVARAALTLDANKDRKLIISLATDLTGDEITVEVSLACV